MGSDIDIDKKNSSVEFLASKILANRRRKLDYLPFVVHPGVQWSQIVQFSLNRYIVPYNNTNSILATSTSPTTTTTTP